MLIHTLTDDELVRLVDSTLTAGGSANMPDGVDAPSLIRELNSRLRRALDEIDDLSDELTYGNTGGTGQGTGQSPAQEAGNLVLLPGQ